MLPRNYRTLVNLPSFNALQPGDILLFRVSKAPYPYNVQKLILWVQALFNYEHGHYDTTHVAMCVDHTSTGEPLIAHITEARGINGYTQELLTDMLAVEPDQDRSFLVFRPKDLETARLAAAIAKDKETHQDVRWSILNALFTIVSRTFPNTIQLIAENEPLSKATICTQFVIEVFHKALSIRMAHGEMVTNQLNISPISPPKALEKCLYDNQEHYDMFCYPGKNVYQDLCSEIEVQLKQIASQIKGPSKEKLAEVENEYKKTAQKLSTSALNNLEKSQILLGDMIPILGSLKPDSENDLKRIARQSCIFPRDIKPTVSALPPNSSLLDIENKSDHDNKTQRTNSCQSACNNNELLSTKSSLSWY